MPSQPINTLILQVARVEGQSANCRTCPTYTWTRSAQVPKVYEVRPQSVSNPVRKDHSRAQSAWRHAAAFQRLGTGQYRDEILSSGEYSSCYGNVTINRSSATAVNHTLSLRILNDARMRALSQLTQSKSQFNVAAYEAKGTISTLNQFCRKAVQGLDDAKRSLKKRDPRLLIPPRAWKSFPGDYLGYLYGLKPLADDISNGLDQLSGLSKQGMAYGYWVRSGRSETHPFDETVSPTADVGIPFRAMNANRTSFARVGYYYLFPEWWIQNTPVVTPFSDAWELTRMSFVLDWALPIGSWIGAMEAAQFDPYFSEGFEVYGTNEDVRGPFRSTISHPNRLRVMSNDTYHNRRYEVVRTGLGPGSKPTGRVAFPSFRSFLGLNTASQSLALLSQAFNKPPRP